MSVYYSYRDQQSVEGQEVTLHQGVIYNTILNSKGEVFVEVSRSTPASNSAPTIPSNIEDVKQSKVEMVSTVKMKVKEGKGSTSHISDGVNVWNFVRVINDTTPL